ncbi:MAG: UDP-N-acetylmuramoyl-tripeptide--D-alanyl-D-alanine ligase [Actinomycetota bacterium]|nr:MAG: UDP-N-acetylmuramoyl-tripeptide--D-alanyl-D-alanine ligase [Actinomycetota bacterium]
MNPLRLRDLAADVDGDLVDVPDPEATVCGAVADSRQVSEGDLYVAIAGERVDGHDFAAGAVAAGAAAVLAARPVGVPAVVVPDPVAALGRLAAATLARLRVRGGPRVVAVTGSSGKTTTKDLLASVLGAAGPVVAPVGSFNTEVGVPLTILRSDDSTATLVLEMGARGVGHIAYLTRIAPPDIAVVLNVGSAHLATFGDRATIAAAKGELVESVAPEGLAVLNADDPLVAAMRDRTPGRVRTFGESAAADVRADSVRLDELGRPSFRLVSDGQAEPVSLPLHGAHQVSNALAAATVALECGLPLPAVAAGLSAVVPASRWRMEVSRTAAGVTVINDAYNANPDSMRAALKALVAMSAGHRSWAVLGEMRELGQDATAEHDAIGRLAVRLDVSRLVAVGAGARPIHLGASHEGSWGQESQYVEDPDAAIAVLLAELRPGDVVLVKASRAVGLERVAEALLAGAATGERP